MLPMQRWRATDIACAARPVRIRLDADRTRLGLSLRLANATGLKRVITSAIFRFYFIRGLRQLRAIVREAREPVAKTA
jgi:hypothetical protein